MSNPMQRVGTVVVTGSEPVSLGDVRAYLNITQESQSALIESLITAAREYFEMLTQRAIVEQSFTITMDGFPGGQLPWWDGTREGSLVGMQGRELELLRPPTLTVEEVATYDIDNTRTVYDASNYFLDVTDPAAAARICLNLGAIWPVNLRRNNAIEVLVTAGYASVPSAICMAIKQMVAYMLENRGDAAGAGAAEASGAMSWIRPFIYSSPGLSPTTHPRRGNYGNGW